MEIDTTCKPYHAMTTLVLLDDPVIFVIAAEVRFGCTRKLTSDIEGRTVAVGNIHT